MVSVQQPISGEPLLFSWGTTLQQPQESETRMTASGLKQDPNTKGSNECYLLRQKHWLQMFGVVPFVKLQNDT